MKRTFVCWYALLSLVAGGTARAQSPKRLPIIAGNGLFHVLVEVDGTVKTWGNPGVWGWGRNDAGGLCDGTKEPRLHPVQAKGISNAVDVTIHGNSIIVLEDGTVRMCGNNTDAWLGDFSGSTTIVQLNDGTLRGWGNGYYGSLGDGHGDRTTARPAAPIGVGPVLVHYTSGSGSYAIRADGTVMVWGVPAAPGGKMGFVLTPIPGFKGALEAVAK